MTDHSRRVLYTIPYLDNEGNQQSILLILPLASKDAGLAALTADLNKHVVKNSKANTTPTKLMPLTPDKDGYDPQWSANYC